MRNHHEVTTPHEARAAIYQVLQPQLVQLINATAPGSPIYLLANTLLQLIPLDASGQHGYADAYMGPPGHTMAQPGVTTAHGQGTRQRHNNTHAGWIQSVPDSWMHHFISCLPASSRLALFTVSRWFAKAVVRNSARVTLLLSSDDFYYEDAHALEAARCIITSLLTEAQQLDVKIRQDEMLPIPVRLSHKIAALTLHYFGYVDTARRTVVPWPGLQGLQKLHLTGAFNNEVLKGLTDALETGQLPKLRCLDWEEGYSTSSKSQVHHLSTLLCQCVTQLRVCGRLTSPWSCAPTDPTSDKSLARHVGIFTALQSVYLYDCFIPSSAAQHLCELPTLQSVTLGVKTGQLVIEGGHSHRNCNWRTLCLHDAPANVLTALPLATAKEIVISKTVRVRESEQTKREDLGALRSLLELHHHKLSFMPDMGGNADAVLVLKRDCQVLFGLLPYTKGIRKLTCERESGIEPKDLWPRLPTCVHIVTLSDYYMKGDPDAFWQDIPTTVKHLKMDFYQPSLMHRACKEMRGWYQGCIVSAPVHVNTITLNGRSTGLPGRWYDKLLLMAPEHLKVVFPCWR